MSPASGIDVKLISVMYYNSIYSKHFYLKNYEIGALPLIPHFILFLRWKERSKKNQDKTIATRSAERPEFLIKGRELSYWNSRSFSIHIHTRFPFCQGHPTVLLFKLWDNVNVYLLHLKENKRPWPKSIRLWEIALKKINDAWSHATNMIPKEICLIPI
jgi:hypothetical protein